MNKKLIKYFVSAALLAALIIAEVWLLSPVVTSFGRYEYTYNSPSGESVTCSFSFDDGIFVYRHNDIIMNIGIYYPDATSEGENGIRIISINETSSSSLFVSHSIYTPNDIFSIETDRFGYYWNDKKVFKNNAASTLQGFLVFGMIVVVVGTIIFIIRDKYYGWNS